jgi:hypothetical protein
MPSLRAQNPIRGKKSRGKPKGDQVIHTYEVGLLAPPKPTRTQNAQKHKEPLKQNRWCEFHQLWKRIKFMFIKYPHHSLSPTFVESFNVFTLINGHVHHIIKAMKDNICTSMYFIFSITFKCQAFNTYNIAKRKI